MSLEIPAHHKIESSHRHVRATDVPSRQLAQLLSMSDGFTLFDSGALGEQPFACGLRFFSLTEILEVPNRLMRDLRTLSELTQFDVKAAELEHANLLPFAEVGGDLLALDLNQGGGDGEPRVLYIDHETFGETPVASARSWSSIEAFLTWFAENPCVLLASSWRVVGKDREQYLPVEVVYR